MKTLARFVAVALFAALLIISCKKTDNTSSTEQKISTEVLNKIKALGYYTGGIIKIKKGYLVEGDILLTDADLDFVSTSPTLRIAESEQYQTNRLIVGMPRVITVTMTNLPATYVAALDAAIARYNALGLRLTFQRVATGGEITITDDFSLPAHILGSSGGTPVVGGNVNPTPVILNQFAIGPFPNANWLTTIIAHEMGHCIGFRHTDYFNRAFSNCPAGTNDEGQQDVGAVHIPGTPTAEEANSWMLACIGPNDNRPFTANDIIALNYLYGNVGHAYTVTPLSCSFGNSTLSISGHIGDVVTVRATAGGYLQWNSVGNGAGVRIALSGPGGAFQNSSSNHIMSPSGGTFSVNANVTFIMTSATMNVTITSYKYNALSGSASGSVYVNNVNNGQLFSSNSASLCIGTNTGTW